MFLIIVSAFVPIAVCFLFGQLFAAGDTAVAEFLLIAGGADAVRAVFSVVLRCTGEWKLAVGFRIIFHFESHSFNSRFCGRSAR